MKVIYGSIVITKQNIVTFHKQANNPNFKERRHMGNSR